jgi:hypothetical protein
LEIITDYLRMIIPINLLNTLSFIRRASENYCPGIEDFMRPTVKYEDCNICSGRLEIWSDEEQGTCLDCGAKCDIAESELSCLQYCDYADICKGIILSRKKLGL